MELAASTLVDLITGPALPLLFSIEGAGSLAALGCVVSGAGAGGLIGWALRVSPAQERGLCCAVDMASALVQLCFSAALLFRQAARIDSEMGAGFCAIPLFHAVCLVPPADARFARELAICLAAATALALVLCAVPGATSGPAEAAAAKLSGADYALLVINAVYATAWGASGDASQGLGPLAARALCFAGVALWPGAADTLLRRRQRPALLVTAGTAALLSAKRQAGHLRRQLERLLAPGPPTGTPAHGAEGGPVRRAQRALMLLVAPTLAVAYTFQWGNWRGASWAALAVLAGRLVAFCAG